MVLKQASTIQKSFYTSLQIRDLLALRRLLNDLYYMNVYQFLINQNKTKTKEHTCESGIHGGQK